MKRVGLLNRHLSALTASLGHTDEIVIADAGLPVPDGVPVIDLALVPGVPGFLEVLRAIRSELTIESAVWAREANADLNDAIAAEMSAWEKDIDKGISSQQIPHEAFKQRSRAAKAIIRTGETTPYANVILVSGVVF